MKGSGVRVPASALKKSLLDGRFWIDAVASSAARIGLRGYTGVHEAPFGVASGACRRGMPRAWNVSPDGTDQIISEPPQSSQLGSGDEQVPRLLRAVAAFPIRRSHR